MLQCLSLQTHHENSVYGLDTQPVSGFCDLFNRSLHRE